MVALVSLLLLGLVELAVFVEVAGAIGFWNAIGLMLIISVVGAWIVKRQGTATWNRAQVQVTAGRVPSRELADGVLLLLAGVLLLLPGFVTSFFGVLLLLPPVRTFVRRALLKRWTGEVRLIRASYRGPIDTTATEPDRRDAGPSEPGRSEPSRSEPGRRPELGAP